MTEQKLKELFKSLSPEEKLGELWQPMNRTFDEAGVLTGNNVECKYPKEWVDLCGSTLNLFGIEKLKALQDTHMANHPHHIPMIFMADVIHGFATIFPLPLAYSCSFDPDLVEELSRVSAKESAVQGQHVTFFPMMDMVRDPRWGRVMESCGEDPYLANKLCAATVRGLQGEGIDRDKYRIGATVKHFAGYGAAEGGRDYNTCELSERTLREYYLPGYKGGIDAGAELVMTSYNAIGGVPSTCNKHLFRDILRDEWGFKGVVISDLFATSSTNTHGVGCGDRTGNKPQRYTAERCLTAGVDIEMGGTNYQFLRESVEEGTIDMAYIDEAVWRVLTLKNKLGLFENPYRAMSEEESKQFLCCPEHMEVAYRSAVDSCVLLKNEDAALPLSRGQKIAFIGPFVTYVGKSGAWAIAPNKSDAGKSLQSYLTATHKGESITFARGCSALGREQVREPLEFPDDIDEEHREELMCQAEQLAAQADTVVLALGELPYMSGEAHSRANIKLPAVQLELFDRVYAVNQNIVVLLHGGRPLDLSDINDRCKAIMMCWYLGSRMEEAMEALIYGKEVPNGKLTMNFPTGVNQIPVYYNHLNTDHRTAPYWSEYIDDYNSEPLYPFGHGLSYSHVEYGKTEVDKTTFGRNDTLSVTCTLTNTGKYAVRETAQLYMRDPLADLARPVKELKGFKKVAIAPGETVTVSFTICEEDLRYLDENMVQKSDAGEFLFKVAPSSRFKDNAFVSVFMHD